MRARGLTSSLCVTALLAGCSGSSNTLPIGRGFIAPSTVSSMRSVSGRGATATLRVKITVPKPRPHAIDPHYMSRSTKGITFAFSGASKFDASLSLTPGSKGCTTNGAVTKCIFNLKLATGKYKGTVSAYDMAPVKGVIPKNANLLSTDVNVPFTVAAGVVNRAGFVFGGVVKSLGVSALPSGTIGTAFTLPRPFSVTAKDADGNIIIGTYDNPITLSDSDTSGATSVPTTLLSSKDTATLGYNGAGIVSAVISASAIGATTASGLFVPAPSVTSMNVNSGLIGTQVSETLHGHFVAGTMSVNPVSGVTVKGVNSTASTVTATFEIDAEAATGTRNVTVSTGAAASVPQTFTISNTGAVVVTKNTDTNPGTPPGTGAGASGDLRYAMLNAHAGDSIVFDPAQMCGAANCTITLAGPLPQIAQNLTIDGGWFTSGSPRVTIDGANTYRAFWATSGTVTIANLQIQNAKAKGGAAGAVPSCEGVGGGGAGLGAAIFIDAATVSVFNDYFLNDSVVGGNGGNIPGGGCSQGSSGGGGLGGDGGAYVGGTYGGGGGGGILGPGGASSASGGGTGGPGFTTVGGTGGTSSSIAGGAGGYGAGGGGAGYNGTGGSGGAGGFGGGGGGAAGNAGTAGGGGAGGFGGGGGGSLAGSCGNGGPGGGGAGCVNRSGSGGSLAASLGGGGGSTLGGGGGAAAGPAIFVTTGTLTTVNSGASGSSATGGAAGLSAVAGGADPTPVFNYAGTVNGVSVTVGNGGPVASALGSSPPQVRRRSTGRDRHRRP